MSLVDASTICNSQDKCKYILSIHFGTEKMIFDKHGTLSNMFYMSVYVQGESYMGELLLLNAKEVCSLIGVSRGTLWRMRCEGQLPPPVFVSRRLVKWRRSDIMAWIESSGKVGQ